MGATNALRSSGRLEPLVRASSKVRVTRGVAAVPGRARADPRGGRPGSARRTGRRIRTRSRSSGRATGRTRGAAGRRGARGRAFDGGRARGQHATPSPGEPPREPVEQVPTPREMALRDRGHPVAIGELDRLGRSAAMAAGSAVRKVRAPSGLPSPRTSDRGPRRRPTRRCGRRRPRVGDGQERDTVITVRIDDARRRAARLEATATGLAWGGRPGTGSRSSRC